MRHDDFKLKKNLCLYGFYIFQRFKSQRRHFLAIPRFKWQKILKPNSFQLDLNFNRKSCFRFQSLMTKRTLYSTRNLGGLFDKKSLSPTYKCVALVFITFAFFLISKLDFCNSLLHNISEKDLLNCSVSRIVWLWHEWLKPNVQVTPPICWLANKRVNPWSAGIDFSRQNLTSEVNPRAVREKHISNGRRSIT